MKRLTVDIPEEMHDWLRDRWGTTGQTMAGQIRLALREYRQREEAKDSTSSRPPAE